MKKIVSIMLCGFMILGITGCGEKSTTEEQNNQEEKNNHTLTCIIPADDESYRERIYTYDETDTIVTKFVMNEIMNLDEEKLQNYNKDEYEEKCNEMINSDLGVNACNVLLENNQLILSLELDIEEEAWIGRYRFDLSREELMELYDSEEGTEAVCTIE